MKTPKGLKKHQAKNQPSNLDLSKVLKSDLAYMLCAKFAENLTGYSHFSDLYDSGPEFTLKMYAKVGSDQFGSDDDDSSSNDSFEKYNYYEEIKDNFKDKVVSCFNPSSVKDLKEFQDFYKLAMKQKAFSGTIEEFLSELTRSREFLSFLGTTVSKYSG